jgi:hypothetical protein
LAAANLQQAAVAAGDSRSAAAAVNTAAAVQQPCHAAYFPQRPAYYPAGRPATANGGAVWRQELEENRCAAAGGATLRMPPRGQQLHRSFSETYQPACQPATSHARRNQILPLPRSSSTASASASRQMRRGTPPSRQHWRPRHAEAAPFPCPPFASPRCSRPLCRPQRRAVSAPLAEGAQP